jgi:hypothetical protein
MPGLVWLEKLLYLFGKPREINVLLIVIGPALLTTAI